MANLNTILNKDNKEVQRMKKNVIKQNLEATAKAKAEAAAAKAEEERLAAIEPRDIVATMDEIVSGETRVVRNEEGNTLGVNGGVLYQEPIMTENGPTTIAANSKEELEVLKANIEQGLSGDGKFHKLVVINGFPCDCCGSTLEELEADIAAAKDYAAAHKNGHVVVDADVAEQLVDAGYKQADTEEVRGQNNQRFILSYKDNNIIDLQGNIMAELEDIDASRLTRKDRKTLLMERLNKKIEELEEEYDDEAYDDEDYDDYDDDDEYEDDEEDEDDSSFGFGVFIR